MVVGKEFWGPTAAVRVAAGLEPGKPPAKWDAWSVRKKRAGFTPRDVAAAHAAYLADEDFRGKRWPVAIFMTPQVHGSRLKRLPPEPAPPSPLELEFEARLMPLRADGHAYAASQLRELRPVAVAGDVLQLRARDKLFGDWCQDHYGEFMTRVRVELLPTLANVGAPP